MFTCTETDPSQDLNFAEWMTIADTLVRFGNIKSSGIDCGINDSEFLSMDVFWERLFRSGISPLDAVVKSVSDLNDPEFSLIAIY